MQNKEQTNLKSQRHARLQGPSSKQACKGNLGSAAVEYYIMQNDNDRKLSSSAVAP